MSNMVLEIETGVLYWSAIRNAVLEVQAHGLKLTLREGSGLLTRPFYLTGEPAAIKMIQRWMAKLDALEAQQALDAAKAAREARKVRITIQSDTISRRQIKAVAQRHEIGFGALGALWGKFTLKGPSCKANAALADLKQSEAAFRILEHRDL